MTPIGQLPLILTSRPCSATGLDRVPCDVLRAPERRARTSGGSIPLRLATLYTVWMATPTRSAISLNGTLARTSSRIWARRISRCSSEMAVRFSRLGPVPSHRMLGAYTHGFEVLRERHRGRQLARRPHGGARSRCSLPTWRPLGLSSCFWLWRFAMADE